MSAKWYVAVSHPCQEIRAAMEITKLEFEVFYPIKTFQRFRKQGAPVQVTGPLFPRYLFAKFDRELDDWGKIKDQRGVADILRNQNRPVAISTSVVEAIRSYREAIQEVYSPGIFEDKQKVRIVSGILCGVEGLFKGSDRQRTKAFLEILGKRYEVPHNTIAAA